MNILCPNCHKNLTVPEQYAGQLMKCPLCSGNFSVPALPPGGVPGGPAPAFDVPASPPPMPAAPSPPAEPDTYGVKHDPAPMPAFMGPPESSAEPPQPAFATSPPPAPASAPAPAPNPAPAPTTPPGASTGCCCRIVFKEAVLKFIPPIALLLIFLLQFMPWVGIYPGGESRLTQGAWGAATGYSVPYKAFNVPDNLKQEEATEKPALRLWRVPLHFPEFIKAEEVKERNADRDKKLPPLVSNEPGWSPLLLFYLLLFLVSVLVTVGVAVLPYVHVALPAPLQQFLPWRWAIVASLNVVLLLFLCLQLLLGFSLESSVHLAADNDEMMKVSDKDNPQIETVKAARRGVALSFVHRTTWLTMAFWLHVLAAGSAAMVWCMEKRGPGKPAPVLELRW